MNPTVADITTTRPRAVGVLHRHRIDFCCGGHRPFAEACRDRGLDPDAVLAEIDGVEAAAVNPDIRWDQAPLAAVIDHLLTRFHDPLRADLQTLDALSAKVLRVHGEKDDRLAGVRDAVVALRDDLLPHLEKEERVLFPWILRPDAPAPNAPIAVMTAEHEEAGAVLATLDALTDGYRVPEGACRSWTALWETLARVDRELREHIALENNVLFPRALAR